jgi:exosome complex component CSL4
MGQQEAGVVFPGERLATEEEFAPSRNVYTENGEIYSTVLGRREESGGSINVAGIGKEIRKMERGMLVLGKVVGVLPAVVFVELNGYTAKGIRYVALMDGKIVMPKRDSRGSRGRDFRGSPQHNNREAEESPFCIGDIILARIYKEDEDIYELDVKTSEDGVIYAKCSVCGGELELRESRGYVVLACTRCRAQQTRRLSVLYNKPEAIRKLFE